MLWLIIVGHLGLKLLCSLSLWHHLLLHAHRHIDWIHHLRGVNLLLMLLRYLLHHERLSEHVYVARILNVVDENVQLGFAYAFLLQEVLNSVKIKAHLAGLLHERFTLVHEVLGDLSNLVGVWSHGKLHLNLSSLLFSPWIWLDIVLAHKVEQLTWHFFKDLFGQKMRVVLEIIERHKLHDICGHILTVGL